MKIVCVGNGQLAQAELSEKVGALNCMHDQQAIICPVSEPILLESNQDHEGGGNADKVNALCARDFKGVGNQYVAEGKCIIQPYN